MLNKDLIRETIRTFGLLFPRNDTRSRKWYDKKRRYVRLDPKAGQYTTLNAAERQTQSFYFWRDRLIVLKQAFDDSEPHTLAMWWRDDRKKVQWYTFWGCCPCLAPHDRFRSDTIGIWHCPSMGRS